MAIEFPGYVNNPLAGLDVGLSHLAGGVDRYLQNKWRRDEEQDRIDRVMRAISGQGITATTQAPSVMPVVQSLGGPALVQTQNDMGMGVPDWSATKDVQAPTGPATSFQEALSRLANMGGVKSVEDIQLLQALAPQPQAPIKGGPGETFYDPKTYKPLFSVPSADSDKRITLTMYNSKTGQKYEQAVKESEYDKKREQLLSNGYTSEAPAPKVDRSAAWTEYQDALGGGFKGTFMQYQEKMSEMGKTAPDTTGENFTRTNQLRESFRKDSGNFPVIAQAYQIIGSSTSGTPQADMSLVFGFMKLVDPGSTVREGEYATAENTRGVPDSIRQAYNKVIDGQRLTQTQRTNFVGQAKNIYSGAEKKHKNIEGQYRDIAKSYNLNPEQVLINFRVPEEVQPITPAAQQANQFYGTKYSVVLE